MIKVSIIITSFNTKPILAACLKSIYEYFDNDLYEIIIIDNASTDGSVKFLRNNKMQNLKVIFNKRNIGFGAANNLGAKLAKGKFLMLLNSDTLITNNILPGMVDWIEKHDNIGVLSCSLTNKDGSIQGTGGFFPTLPRVFSWMTIQDLPFVDSLIKPFHPMKEKSLMTGAYFYKSQRELDWVTGAFMLIPRNVYKKVSGFDTDYFMYTEEVDLCFRIKTLGYKVYYNPEWQIVHLGGSSGKTGDNIIREFEGVKIFYQKHYPKWQMPILRLLLKKGSLLRMLFYKLTEKQESYQLYRKAFYEV